jgi:glycosyltransferase involved in cell wall biosynthesis
LRILIDALSARVGGGITYIRNILPALSRLKSRHEFSVMLSSRYQGSLTDAIPGGMEPIWIDIPAEPIGHRWWFQQTKLPEMMLRRKTDLLYAIAESSYFRVPARFVMQATNWGLYAPTEVFGINRWRMKAYRLTRQYPVYLSMRKADCVVFISKTFSDQVSDSMRLNSVKGRVVYYGVSPIFWERTAPTRSICNGNPYFLSVSTVSPNKNYESLLRAYARLASDSPHLVIAGRFSNDQTFRMLQSIISEEALGNRVHFLGEVAYDELPAIYRGSIALVFPSRLESFGHPLVEAMASGTPVIASDLPVFREVCQDAALYFPPHDIGMLSGYLSNVQRDKDLQDSLSRRGQERARSFSWDESARRLTEIFDELG